MTENFKVDDLKMLYKLCFEVTGKVSDELLCVWCNLMLCLYTRLSYEILQNATLKKELKQFQGFGFNKDGAEYKKKQTQLNKLVNLAK